MLRSPSSRWLPVALTGAALLAVMVLPGQAQAIPAFARKYSFECSQCHTAWPKLNAFGRDFKMNGYKVEGELEDEELSQIISDFQNWDKQFPISAVGKLRPYDKKKNNDSKIRAFHEAEIMVAGRAYKNVSMWMEFEAEDETNFHPELEAAIGAWNLSPEANIAMGWGPVFWADPFETFADGGRRMTRSHKGPLDQRFGAGERLRSASQWVAAYGRLAQGRVYYVGGVSSGGEDAEGGDSKDLFGRLAVEATPGVYAGGFIQDGTNDAKGFPLDFTRYGFDAQIEKGNFNAYGMVMVADDQFVEGAAKSSTTVGYVEALYTIHSEAIPLIVPLVRVDFLDQYTDITANLGFYLAENWRAYAEFWSNLDTPDSKGKDNRFTIQTEFAF